MNAWTRGLLLGVGTAAVARVAGRRTRRMDLNGAVVVISGGSRGLGLALARDFARHGARIVLLARDDQELARAREDVMRFGNEVLALPCDVRFAPEIERAIREVVSAYGRVDVLVNAAGVIQVAPFEHITNADFDESLGVHVWGPLHLMRAVLPHMPAGGRIVNISSIAGLVAVPHLLPYTTGKFALRGLSDGLRSELIRRGIYVTTVCPGLMRTGSHVNARFKGRREEEFTWFALGAAFPLLSTSAPKAARKIVAACREGRPQLIITPQARLFHLLDAVAPNTTARLVGIAARLLPAPADAEGDRERPGWQSRSAAAPSMLTRLADRNIGRNNELTGEAEAAYFSKNGSH